MKIKTGEKVVDDLMRGKRMRFPKNCSLKVKKTLIFLKVLAEKGASFYGYGRKWYVKDRATIGPYKSLYMALKQGALQDF